MLLLWIYCLKRVSPSHPQENPEVREYGFGARFRHPVGVAAMSVLVERILPTA